MLYEVITKLSSLLMQNKIYKIDESFIHSIAIGEDTSRLSEILNNLAKLYNESNRDKTNLLLSLLEPVFMLVVGVIIGFIVIAMLLPIFSMNLGWVLHKKGIVLFITLFFIVAFSILIIKNLDDTDKYIQQSEYQSNINQVLISIKNTQEQFSNLLSKHTNKIKDILEEEGSISGKIV